MQSTVRNLGYKFNSTDDRGIRWRLPSSCQKSQRPPACLSFIQQCHCQQLRGFLLGGRLRLSRHCRHRRFVGRRVGGWIFGCAEGSWRTSVWGFSIVEGIGALHERWSTGNVRVRRPSGSCKRTGTGTACTVWGWTWYGEWITQQIWTWREIGASAYAFYFPKSKKIDFGK